MSLIAGSLSAAANAADRVYWANYTGNKISFANLNGSGGGDLVTTGATVSNPFGVAIDVAANRVYWANFAGGKISFADLNGNGGGDLTITGATVNGPEGLAIDPTAGRIYWANDNADKISVANLDGSGGADLNTTGANVDGVQGLAIDPTGGRIFWTNTSGPGPKISFANLNGSGNGQDLVTTGATLSLPSGLAIDRRAGRIYWANGATKISFAKLDDSGGGGDLATTGATVSDPRGVAIDPAAGRIWWANEGPGKISFASLGGGGGGDLVTTGATTNAPEGVALLEIPRGIRAPAITGGSAPGSLLSCSRGSWAGDLLGAFLYRAPRSFAFQWRRNGADIAGATASSYKARLAGSYRCRATAANAAGAKAQQSAVHRVFPDTKITEAKIDHEVQSAKLSFRGIGGPTGFQCALIKTKKKGEKTPKPHFSSCSSPKRYKQLNAGKYTFEARALSAAGADPTPAKRSFKI